MTDATLLQAILDDPDDIAARRVYADALIAEGSPRGELINVQCAFEDAVPTERAAEARDRAAQGECEDMDGPVRRCELSRLEKLVFRGSESPAKSTLKPLLDRGIRIY